MNLEIVNWKALRTGLRTLLKSAAGYPHRPAAERAWELGTDEFWHIQGQALERMYAFARNRVPFYRDQTQQYPARLKAHDGVLAALADLPTLAKSVVRAHNERLWPVPRLPLTSVHTTSGTSGTPLRLTGTLFERGMSRAVFESWYRKICGERSPKTLYLSGFMTPSAGAHELSWRDPTTGGRYLSIYSLRPEHAEAIAQLIQRDRPRLIYGYASAIHQLALLMADRLIDSVAERTVVVTSEVLEVSWRAQIEASLGARLYDMYSSQEGCHLALECDAHRLHIHPLIGVIEIVDDDGAPSPPGATGRVLVTGLVRRSMPLIRYELGDVAESTGYATGCSCGLAWPTLGRIGGRSEDLVRTPDGRRIGYLCFHATKDLRGVRESQLVQRAYDRFVFNLVLQPHEVVPTAEIEGKILAQLTARLGYAPRVEFRYVDSIPRGPRGKFKAVVVEIDT